MKIIRNLGATAVAGLLLAGCASYYEVTNLNTGKSYYTNDIRRQRDGSVEFRDAVTGGTVSLADSEIREVSRATFRANTPR